MRSLEPEVLPDSVGDYAEIDEELKLRAVFMASPDAIVVTDLNGDIEDCNPAASDMLGYPSEEDVIGRNALEFVAKRDRERAMQTLKQVLDQGSVRNVECLFMTKEGRRFPAELSASVIEDASGTPMGLVTIGKDITERRGVQKELREREELFRSVVENSHDGILIVDNNYKFIYVNEELSGILGYSKEKIVGQDFRKFLAEESRALVSNRYIRRQKGEKVPPKYELRVIRKSGEKRDLEIKSTVMRNKQGRIQTVAQVLDITDQKRMAEDRRSFEESLSALNLYGRKLNMAENMDQICELTLDAMESILGYEQATFMMLDKDTLHVRDQRGYPQSVSLKLPLNGSKGGITVKAAEKATSILVPDVGEERAYVEVVPGIRSELAVPIKLGPNVLGVLNVESKTLDAFQERDQKLLEILASHSATAISNLERQEQIRERSEELAYLMESSIQLMQSECLQERLQIIAQTIRKIGWRRTVISVRDQNLEMTDLVTKGLTEEEVELLLERKTPGKVWQERLGPEFGRFKIGEFYYLPWSDPWVRERVHGVSPDTQERDPAIYAGVPSKLTPEEMVDWHPQDMLYAPLRLPDGKIVGIISIDDPVDGRRPTKQSLVPLQLFLHQAAVAVQNAQLIRDLDTARSQLRQYAENLEAEVKKRTKELRESQKQLVTAERLAAIGEAATIVGHDLRNPLQSIENATYILRNELLTCAQDHSAPIPQKAMEMLQVIDDSGDYADKIIRDLQDFSTTRKPSLTKTDLNTLIKEALSQAEMPEDVELETKLRHIPPIEADKEMIKRVLLNLTINGIQAMERGGILKVSTRKVEGFVEIVLRDTGLGIPKENREKIFTPFFTTKARGMGMGLPICKKLVQAHGGQIQVESQEGVGSTFTVKLPIQHQKGGETNDER
ncbi:PAS domain S-box protein [Candidatus Bathyarchaeota archaeon]|nr:PAS domain S-box protein [Candidatus Bathyarchaeota archaeon]NIU81869.1 PAS domain S-box protein [Candidatus Bathyarchaeota archaeon]NIV68502.1 PAS domain S-box protein [Candidatus Bathyarchaeota archaeon]NIW16797.1 PAS domain S-box protein [Candidatus Bathyarchaeota archaeon]NIW34786.1 PAS domain S-box protein [Candidatus Bathyarchaeota archaeon]